MTADVAWLLSALYDGCMIGIDYHITAADLQDAPLCVNAMRVIEYAQENGGIPLTKSGAFNRKFVDWAANAFNWPGYTADELYRVNKVLNEDDFLPLMVIHHLFWLAKIGRHYKGKFLLTPKGRKLVGNHVALQRVLFETLLYEYDLQNIDRFPDDNDPDWEIMMGVMDREVRDWVSIGHMLNIFFGMAMENADYGSDEYRAAGWFWSRVVRPLVWLGLLECEEGELGSPMHERKVRMTPLWSKWFRFEHHQPANISKTLH